MPLSLYLKNAWLNHLTGNTVFAKPTQWYVQLHYGDPGYLCTGNVWSWSATSRQSCPSWSAASAKANSSVSVVSWSGLGDPGANTQVRWISVWDAATAGNPLSYGQLTTPVTITLGGSYSLSSGAIVQTVT